MYWYLVHCLPFLSFFYIQNKYIHHSAYIQKKKQVGGFIYNILIKKKERRRVSHIQGYFFNKNQFCHFFTWGVLLDLFILNLDDLFDKVEDWLFIDDLDVVRCSVGLFDGLDVVRCDGWLCIDVLDVVRCKLLLGVGEVGGVSGFFGLITFLCPTHTYFSISKKQKKKKKKVRTWIIIWCSNRDSRLSLLNKLY